MAYEQRDNSGSLFKNDKKETEKHPDYTGQAMIAGVEYWVSAWINESKSGAKYMSFKYKSKDDARKEPLRQDGPRDSRSTADILSDEVPF